MSEDKRMAPVEKFAAIWAIISIVVCLIFSWWCVSIDAAWVQFIVGAIGVLALVSTVISLVMFGERVYTRIKRYN